VHPGEYTVRLTVNGIVREKPIRVRLDPRVEISDADLELQTRYSLALLKGNRRAQALKRTIDGQLAGVDPARRDRLLALRGDGDAENPNIHYGSIYASSADEETIVGLQEKLVYMLKILQAADAKPTSQAVRSVDALLRRVGDLERRHAEIMR
jgi:hypothetical protein